MAKWHGYTQAIRVADLREQIDLQDATTPTDGNIAPTYANHVTGLWAEVLETAGGEYLRGRQIEANVRAVITIRYRSDVTPRMRVKWGTRYLYVKTVHSAPGRTYTVLDCSEVQP